MTPAAFLPPPGRRLARALPLLILILVPFAVYSNTLLNGFVDDDEAQVLRNPWITSVRFLPEIFTRNVWSFLPDTASNYYRPLMHVVYLIAYHLFGLHPWGFHLVNILLHAANSLMVMLLASLIPRLDGGRRTPAGSAPSALLSAPFMAALLFATHPVHTEAVSWIASVPELCFTLLCLLSLCAYAAAPAPFATLHWISAAAFFLALLCKETALVLPLLLLGYDLTFRSREHPMASGLFRFPPYIFAAAGYLVLRYQALPGSLLPPGRPYALNETQAIINALPLFARYLGMLLWPHPLNFWHTFHPIESLFSATGIVSLAIVCIFLATMILAFRRYRPVFFALLVVALPLLPALYIKVLPGKPFAERYLYFPSVGFAIAAAAFLCGPLPARLRRAVPALSAAIVLAYSGMTVARNMVWKNAETLFTDTVRQSPDADLPRYDLAIALINRNRVDEALPHFRLLVETHPGEAKYHSGLGSALLQKNRVDEAISELNLALALAPGTPEARNDLGVALRRKGLLAEGIEAYRQVLETEPDNADAHYNLWAALADEGRVEEATKHLDAAIRLRPENPFYHNMLGIEFAKQGSLGPAIEHFREAVRLAPDEPAYRRNLEKALARKSVAVSGGAGNP